MHRLQDLLVADKLGEPTTRHLVVASRDWDEIKLWSDEVYMPYTVRPTGRARQPDSSLYAAAIGGFTLSRFHYRIPIHTRDFSREAGMGLVLTGLRGAVRHWQPDGAMVETGVGDAYLVDTSRSAYRADFNAQHLQLNLVFPHQLLADLYLRWYGRAADERMWQKQVKFGGAGSAWLALLDYCGRCVTELPEQVAVGPLGKHLEEQLGMHLLAQWERQRNPSQAVVAETPLTLGDVVAAERYMRAHAASAPTLSMVAAGIGTNVQALSMAFDQLRQTTPGAFLREERLLGMRAALRAAPPGSTVGTVARQWGYDNVMMFSAAYQRRFNEWPSQALRRMRSC